MLKKISITFIIIFFLFSRAFVLLTPPKHYSDVKQDYERYANIWWYGMEPYLEHFYEYPPATIPFLVFPLALDQFGIGKYYSNYRMGIFLIDLVFFLTLIKVLKKNKIKKESKNISLLFYILAGLIAKDFLYDGIDTLFASFLALSFASLILLDQNKLKNRIIYWFMFWFSSALKFMSLALTPLLFLVRKFSFKKEIVAMALGFLLIWLGPTLHYRTSLSVSYVFHANRPLKYSSFGNYLIEGINTFTNSEHRVNQPPDFQMEGPISTKMNKAFKIFFPISVFVVILSGWMFLTKKINIKKNIEQIFGKGFSLSYEQQFQFLLKFSLFYIITIFITGIVFSQPFPIWLVPLTALYPFKNKKNQIKYMLGVLLLLLLLTSSLIKIDPSTKLIPPFQDVFLVSTIRVIITFAVWFMTVRLKPAKIIS
jgi:hypothetical protein